MASFFIEDFMMFKAINDRIVVKLDESEEPLIIGCYEDISRKDRGIVVSIGNKVKAVSVGEHIIFHLFDEIELPEDKLVVIREKSVLAKII